MPIYEYGCSNCGREFEVILQGSSEAKCPSCGSRQLTKRLSVFAVGGSGSAAADREPVGPCRACGDPRGPGSCAID